MAKKPVSPALIADKATLALSAEEGGNSRVVYQSWDVPKVVLDGQHLQIRRGPQGVEV
jgi:hypothetical protein